MPKGLPTANTMSPTSILSLSANVTGSRSLAFTFSTAMSDFSSPPTTLALSSRPSGSFAFTSSAPSTTWLFVSRYPSLDTTTADPAPVWRGAGAPRLGICGPKKNSNGSWKGTGFILGRVEVKTCATDADDFLTMGAKDRGIDPSRSIGFGSTFSFGAGPRPESSLACDAGTAPRKRMPVATAKATQRNARVSGVRAWPGSVFIAFMFSCSFRLISCRKVARES